MNVSSTCHNSISSGAQPFVNSNKSIERITNGWLKFFTEINFISLEVFSLIRVWECSMFVVTIWAFVRSIQVCHLRSRLFDITGDYFNLYQQAMSVWLCRDCTARQISEWIWFCVWGGHYLVLALWPAALGRCRVWTYVRWIARSPEQSLRIEGWTLCTNLWMNFYPVDISFSLCYILLTLSQV